MSFAMDDIGLIKSLKNLPVDFFRSKIIEKTSNENDSNSDSTEESEKVDFSKNLSAKIANTKDNLNEAVEGANLLETASNGLSLISGNLDDVEEQIQKLQEEDITDEEAEKIIDSVKKDLENIDNTAKDTSFNNIKPLDGSSYNSIKINTENNDTINISSEFKDSSLQALGLPESKDLSLDTKEKIDDLSRKINDAQAEVQKRQKNLDEDYKKIVTKVSNLIEIDAALNTIDIEKNANSDIEQIKQNAITGILETPRESVKIQITTLDESMLLAMISLFR